MDVAELTPADILSRTDGGAYVVRKIWHKPKFMEGQTYPDFETTGFTLLDTKTLTDREVEVSELQKKLDDGTLVPYQPITVRIVPKLTPQAHHNQRKTQKR